MTNKEIVVNEEELHNLLLENKKFISSAHSGCNEFIAGLTYFLSILPATYPAWWFFSGGLI